jgi:hypothetical protein
MNRFERRSTGKHAEKHAGGWEPMPEHLLRMALSHHRYDLDSAFMELAKGKTLETSCASYRQVCIL